ncbi:MAG: MBL fold metallo-hydrolase [Actinobacteria bacterium]|nr:MBL fold metallo-hydrolase [Actinomycetota bacterium]NDE79567.1 MBL fold metallo-hydrolase [Actinomycetota bacterium]
MARTGMLDKSAAIIDGTSEDGLKLTVTTSATEVEELDDGVAVIESFSNVVSFETTDGHVLFDVSHALSAPSVVEEFRHYTDTRVNTAVYTHGHTDHVGGAHAFDSDATKLGFPRIRYVGHEAITARFDRYKLTNGYNGHINMRQFRLPAPTFPKKFVYPDVTYRESTTLDVGGRVFELHHARGETDDHTWAWVPDAKAVVVGDFFIWQFPNAGNPQKVQRYAWDWAVALREMAALGPELMLPAHGPAIGGRDRVAMVLNDTASALEFLHDSTLALMNAGARLDDIIHTVKLPDELATRPFLKATYDEPEFVVRNIWRLYGGWYDGNPAHLKPAREMELAREMAALAGGADVLARRGEALAADGELRLACHLVEMAALAEPESKIVHGIRAAVYEQRRRSETSMMATGIYRAAMHDSRQKIDEN